MSATLPAEVSGDGTAGARREAVARSIAERARHGVPVPAIALIDENARGMAVWSASAAEHTRTGDGRDGVRAGAMAVEDRPQSVTQMHDPERYSFLGEHGRGGLGRVSRVHDRVLGRDVAIKELIARGPVDEVRFLREALITARLEHPGIVPVHEAGRWPDGTPYYAMKLVSGRSLRALIAERRTVEERIGLLHHVIAVADAIAYAHGRNIIHRDLKPANVIIGEFGETVVIDWGLAKDVSAVEETVSGVAVGAGSRDDDLTAAGSVLGTPAYMAPEQERGEQVDRRADVFAIGAMMWELCTLERLAATRPHQRRSRLSRARIDRDLAAIIIKALEADPERRYRDAGALASDLKAFKAGARIAARQYSVWGTLAHWTRRHRRMAASAIAAVVCAAVGVAMYVRSVAVERDRADQAAVSAAWERDRARLSEASLLLEKDPVKAREQIRSLGVRSPQHALLMSRANQRAAARVIPFDAGVENLFRSPDGGEIVVVTREGELYRIDPGTGTKQLVDRDVKQGIAVRDGEWLYARRPFGEPAVSLSTPSQPRALEAGESVEFLMLVALDKAVYGLDSFKNLFKLSDGEAPVLVKRGVRNIAGDGSLLLICALDGTLEGMRDDVVVFRRRCLQNLSPEMMVVAGDGFASVTAPHVLTVARGGRTFDVATEIAGEYELAMSRAGVVVLADYRPGGRSWFVRAGAEEVEAGPAYAAPLYCVAAGGSVAAWGYRDGRVSALDTSTGAVWVLTGHADAVFHMVISGNTLVTASRFELRVWDLNPPPVREVGRMPCDSATIQPSPDDRYIGMDCKLGDTWLWTRSSGQLRRIHKHTASSVGVQWLGDRLCSVGWDGVVLCSTADGEQTRAFDTSAGKLLSLVASPDHTFLAFASPDGRIWKVDDGLHELYSQDAVPSRVAVSQTGALLASSGLDGSLVVFDVTANRVVARVTAHSGAATSVGWLGDQLWTSGVDGTLRWWRVTSGGVEPDEVVRESGRFRLTRVFADGWVANVREGVLLIQRPGEPAPLQLELDKHIDAIDVSPDMRYVAVSVPGEIVVVDIKNDRLATLNIESQMSMSFIDAETLAFNAAGSVKEVHVRALEYLAFPRHDWPGRHYL